MYERTVFNNGLRIITSTMEHTRSLSIGIFIGTGSRHENESHAGVSHFLEHMLFKGTETWPEPEMISSAIESVGGMLNASTSREATVYWAKVARDHFLLAINLLADMVLRPLIKPSDIEMERKVIQEELAMTNDQPDARADLLIEEILWPNQPMGRDVGGTKDSVANIPRDALLSYHASQYVPNNAVLCVAGNITHEEVLDAVEKSLGSWKPGQFSGWHEVIHSEPGPLVALEQRQTDQAHLCLAIPGASIAHPLRYALDLLNTVLGVGMSSRLFIELRERQGLAYEIQSSTSHYRDCGSMVVYCGVDPTQAPTAVSAILHELEKLHHTVSSEELHKSAEFLNGRLILRMEDTRAVMSWLGSQELLQDHILTPDEAVDLIRGITLQQVQLAAESFISPINYKLAVVGPYRSKNRFERLLALS